MEISTLSDWFITGGIAAVIVGSVIKGVFDLYKIKIQKKKNFSDQFKKRALVYEAMNKILQNTSAKRVLIWKTQNGGGRPRTGAEIYASVIYEDFEAPFISVINDYQRVRVDKEYNNILQHIATSEDERIVLLTSKMAPSRLKSMYDKDNVALADVFYLHESDMEFYYMSVVTDAENMNELASGSEQISVDIYVDAIRRIMRNNKT